MPETHTKRRKRARSAEERRLIEPDRSQIVAHLPGGWSIKRLATAGDLRREGLIMRHCLAKYAGDELIDEMPGAALKSLMPDDAPAPVVDIDLMREQELRGRHLDLELYSLRDHTNLPHATVWALPGAHACDAKGFRNSDLKAAYHERLRKWLAQTGTVYYSNPKAAFYRVLDGRLTELGIRAGLRRYSLAQRMKPCECWQTCGHVSERRRAAIERFERESSQLVCDLWKFAGIHLDNQFAARDNADLAALDDLTEAEAKKLKVAARHHRFCQRQLEGRISQIGRQIERLDRECSREWAMPVRRRGAKSASGRRL